MKKIIAISLAGVLVGSIFALYMFSSVEKEVSLAMTNDFTVTAFQIGVFNVYENALKLKEEHSSSFIYNDDSKYRVFIAIYQDQEIINNMQEYYQNNNVNVYLKEINTNDNFIEKLNKYESLLKESNDLETYVMANKNILKAFSDTL